MRPLGDELITNGDFSNGAANWTLGAGYTYNANAVDMNAATAMTQTILTSGKMYLISFELSNSISGIMRIKAGTNNGGFTFGTNGVYSIYLESNGTVFGVDGLGSYVGSIDNVSVKEMLVNRESTTTNTGIVERAITGSNESELWLETESTSVVNNTGIVERPITGVNESDALFPDNTDSTVVNISDTIIPLLTALEARATTFENREATQNILINLQKC